MLQINITTQPIRLEYTNNHARLELETTQPKVQLETTAATLEISSPQGILTIDQTPCRYSIGFKNLADFGRDNASLARQTAMDGIARIAQDGDQLAGIESSFNVIAQIAANSMISPIPDITYASIALPNISYQANPVQFNPTDGKVELTLHRGTVQGNYQPGSVDVRVTQYPSIEFSTVDVKV